MTILIGIDIGTTNIEYALKSSATKDIRYYIEKNPLSKYGLDVMTRITKANNGLLDEMSATLRAGISARISDIIKDYMSVMSLDTVVSEELSISIAANTTMVHILMDYDCTNLGSYPFSPVHIEEIKTSSESIGIKDISCPVTITPGLSAFVGGDIVSGLSSLSVEDDFLLIDLGTNAEMVLVKGNTAYITSAAAGPAFETCSYGHATDAVDGLFHMHTTGIMDDSGLLCDEFFDSGYNCQNMHFSQKKIRDFQMAKSAIRTGIDLLVEAVLEDAKMTMSELLSPSFSIFIAGNFGAKLNIINAIQLKMFPNWFLGRCQAIGNTSLAGTLINSSNHKIYDKRIDEIVLANHPSFNDYYIDNMNF